VSDQWDKAYLRQASSDYEVFRQLLSMPVPPCHQLHYLQMATEKLAKAFLSANARGRRQPNKHESLVHFLNSVDAHDAVRRAFGYESKSQQMAFLRSIMPIARAIEAVYPKALDAPNLEYPWESSGRVLCPRDYDFTDLHLTGRESIPVLRFTRFIEQCLKTAEAW